MRSGARVRLFDHVGFDCRVDAAVLQWFVITLTGRLATTQSLSDVRLVTQFHSIMITKFSHSVSFYHYHKILSLSFILSL